MSEIILLLLEWGLAQQPYLVDPDMTSRWAAAPAPTIAFMLASVPVGALFLLPSPWLVFGIFKAPKAEA